MGGVTDLIIVGDEAWDPADLQDALEHPRCGHFGMRALTEVEIGQLVRAHRHGGDTAQIARSFGISRRTVYRYLAEYARRPLPCPGPRCLTKTPGGRLCHFCRRTP